MSYTAFQTVSGPLSNANVRKLLLNKTIKYGLRSDVDIAITGDVQANQTRRGATFTNVLSTFGVLEPELIDDPSLPDGINARLINSLGEIDPDQVSEELRRSGRYRGPDVCKFADDVVANGLENHTSVLYNLIRLWIIATAVENRPGPDSSSLRGDQRDAARAMTGFDFGLPTAAKSDIFDVKQGDIFYDDGHVAVSYSDYLGRAFTEEFTIEFSGDLMVTSLSLESMSPFNFSPSLKGMSPRDIDALTHALVGWKCNYPARIAHASPTLAKAIVVDVNSSLSGYLSTESQLLSSTQYFTTLKKYVSANRLQGQFDIAYFMAVQALYAPLPRAIEANGWVSPVNKVYMPRVHSIRGLNPVFTQGSKYQPYAEAELTYANFINYPSSLSIHAIAATDAFFSGIFEIMTATGDGLVDAFYKLSLDAAERVTPMLMFLEAATYRFGKPHSTAWRTAAGVDYVSHLMDDVVQQLPINVTKLLSDTSGYRHYTVSENGVDRIRIVADEVRPVIFPVLSYGVNTERYYPNAFLNELDFKYESNYDAYVFTGARQANKALNMLRVIGYDAVISDVFRTKSYRNWAANSNGHVMPMVPPDNGETVYVLQTTAIKRRAMNWAVLSLGSNFKLMTRVRPRDYVIYASGKQVMVTTGTRKTLTDVPKPIDFKDMAAAVITTRADKLVWRGQGFQLAATPDQAVAANTISLSQVMTALPQDDTIPEMDGQLEESQVPEAE